jgi:antitoxin component YwqK of YwqJK toxin-antitoxin module
MKKKTAILFLWILASLFLAGPLAGQDAETIKEKKIASRTVHEYFLEQGMDKAVVESIEKYDENGKLTEIKEFNSKGEVKLWEEYTYNEEGKVVEARYFNARGNLESREKNIYSDGLRTEKLFYNNKDKLVKRKVYEYEYRD